MSHGVAAAPGDEAPLGGLRVAAAARGRGAHFRAGPRIAAATNWGIS